MAIRRSLYDWRAWACGGALLVIFAIDQFTPTMTVAPFLAVPVVAAATFAGPILVAFLAATAVGLDLLAGWLHGDWPVIDYWHRFVALIVVGILAVIVARAADQSRARLHRSEEHSRLLAENASDIVIVLTDGGVVQWVSPSITPALGWLPADLVGRPPCRLIHDAHLATVRSAWEMAESALASWPAVEFQASRPDDSYVWLSATGRRAGPGTVVAGIRVVTEEVEGRLKLQRAEERYRRLTEEMSDVVWTLDVATLMFTYVSPSVYELRGYTPEEVMATPMDAALTADDSARIRALLVARSQISSDASSHPYVEEVLQPRKDGSTIWTEVVTRYVIDPETGRAQVHGVSRDITNRRLAESTLAASEARLSMVMNASSDIIVQEGQGSIDWVSPSLTANLGWNVDEWEGRHLADFVHPEDRHASPTSEGVHGQLPNYRCRMRTADESYRWMDVRSASIAGVDGAPLVISTMRDVEDAVRREQDLHRRATVDELTGALNRDAGLSLLQDVVNRRHPGSVVAVLFCDIDHFKQINDTHGHDAGDAVLSLVCDRIRLRLRETDVLVRLGGDEFLVLIQGLRDLAGARRVAEAVRESVAAIPRSIDDVPVSISVGVTLMTRDDDAITLVGRADEAMYAAKRAGRNQVVLV